MSIINLSQKKQYDLLVNASAIIGAIATQKIMTKGWKSYTKSDPPQNPDSPSVFWKEALLWGAVSGLTVGIMKVVSRRVSSASWRKFKGPKP